VTVKSEVRSSGDLVIKKLEFVEDDRVLEVKHGVRVICSMSNELDWLEEGDWFVNIFSNVIYKVLIKIKGDCKYVMGLIGTLGGENGWVPLCRMSISPVRGDDDKYPEGSVVFIFCKVVARALDEIGFRSP